MPGMITRIGGSEACMTGSAPATCACGAAGVRRPAHRRSVARRDTACRAGPSPDDRREIEREEVVPVGLDFRSQRNGEAQATEDLRDLVDDRGHRCTAPIQRRRDGMVRSIERRSILHPPPQLSRRPGKPSRPVLQFIDGSAVCAASSEPGSRRPSAAPLSHPPSDPAGGSRARPIRRAAQSRSERPPYAAHRVRETRKCPFQPAVG